MADSSTKQDVEPVRRGPRSALPRLEQELERFFGQGWPTAFNWPSNWPSSFAAFDSELPRVDVVDRENEVCVKAEVPGFKKKEIEISASRNTLTIKAQTSSEKTEEDGDYYRREMSQGFLSRTVSLPAEVDGDNAKARLDNGVLEVTMPKVATAKRKRVTID